MTPSLEILGGVTILKENPICIIQKFKFVTVYEEEREQCLLKMY